MAHFCRSSLIAAALFLGAFGAYAVPASGCFDDEKLKQLQLQVPGQRGSMVYVWSPRGVYSVHQAEMAARAAAANGLDFVIVHDMRVPPKELWTFKSSQEPQRTVTVNWAEENLATPPFAPVTQASVPLCAAKLIHSEALRHFPTAFIITAQGVHRHPIVGAMPPAAWLSSIAQRLSLP